MNYGILANGRTAPMPFPNSTPVANSGQSNPTSAPTDSPSAIPPETGQTSGRPYVHIFHGYPWRLRDNHAPTVARHTAPRRTVKSATTADASPHATAA